jgi:hypothetical protein
MRKGMKEMAPGDFDILDAFFYAGQLPFSPCLMMLHDELLATPRFLEPMPLYLGIESLFTACVQEHPAFFRFRRHLKGIRDRLRQGETSVR